MWAKTTVLKITNITALVTKSESIFSLQTATDGFIEDCSNKINALKETLLAYVCADSFTIARRRYYII